MALGRATKGFHTRRRIGDMADEEIWPMNGIWLLLWIIWVSFGAGACFSRLMAGKDGDKGIADFARLQFLLLICSVFFGIEEAAKAGWLPNSGFIVQLADIAYGIAFLPSLYLVAKMWRQSRRGAA